MGSGLLSLKSFLSFYASIGFHHHQVITRLWSEVSLPDSAFPPFYLAEVLPPNKPLAFLTLSQHLLLRGPT